MNTVANRILDWASRARTSLIQLLHGRGNAVSPQTSTDSVEASAVQPAPDISQAEIVTAISDLRAALAEVKAELAMVRDCAGNEPVMKEAKRSTTTQAFSNDRSAVIRFNKEFLNEHYDLRYNVLKRATEFRPRL